MNLSRGQLLFEEMRKRWYTRKLKDEFEMTHYFRVNGSCLFVSPSKFTFIAWIQPPLSLIYLLFLIFVIYIFAKEKMFGFLQGIIVFAKCFNSYSNVYYCANYNCIFQFCKFIRTHAVPLVLHVFGTWCNTAKDNSHGSPLSEDSPVNQQGL